MNYRATIILAVIFGLSVAGILLLNKKDKQKEELKQVEGKLLDVEKQDILELFLYPNNIHAVKDSNEWRLLSPVVTDGDKNAIDAITDLFSWAKVERTISSDPNEYRDFNLNPARGKIIVIRENKTDTIYVGDKNPTGSFVFARKSGDPRVFLSTTTLESEIQKTLFDVRYKKVLGFESNEVRGVHLKSPRGLASLVKRDNEWEMTAPVAYRANGTKIDEIFNRLRTASAKSFVTENPENLKDYGLDNPIVKFEVLLGEDRAKKSVVIGKKSGQGYFAKDESRSPIFLVDSTVYNLFQVPTKDFRFSKVVDITASDIDKVEFQHHTTLIVCAKDSNGVWSMTTPQSNKVKTFEINNRIRDIQYLEVDEFAADYPSSLAPFGLSKPEVTVRLYQTETLRAEVHLGNKKGDKIYAKNGAINSVFLVKGDIYEKLTPKAEDLIEVVASDTTQVTQIN